MPDRRGDVMGPLAEVGSAVAAVVALRRRLRGRIAVAEGSEPSRWRRTRTSGGARATSPQRRVGPHSPDRRSEAHCWNAAIGADRYRDRAADADLARQGRPVELVGVEQEPDKEAHQPDREHPPRRRPPPLVRLCPRAASERARLPRRPRGRWGSVRPPATRSRGTARLDVPSMRPSCRCGPSCRRGSSCRSGPACRCGPSCRCGPACRPRAGRPAWSARPAPSGTAALFDEAALDVDSAERPEPFSGCRSAVRAGSAGRAGWVT